MGDWVSFLIIAVVIFVVISLPFFLHFLKHLKTYKKLKEEESMNLSDETDEEFATRITREILEKYSKKTK